MRTPPAVQTVSHEAAAPPLSPPCPAGDACDRAIECCPAEDRLPLCPTDETAAESAEWLAQKYPDEYLFDGGDRDYPVHYDAFNMRGLETEDAVAEYYDDTGKRKVKPTNRVAIYAPRFAAVTSLSGPSEGVAVGRAAGTEYALHGVGLRNQQATAYHVQRDSTERLDVRIRGSGLDGGLGQADFGGAVSAAQNDVLLGSDEESNFVQSGLFRQSDEAVLALGIHSAVAWTRDQNPVVSAHSEALGEVYSKFTANEFVGKEEPIRRKGDLRIVKLADKKTAAPGDIVTFTIRYDNLGDLDLREVVILDNLTPRLEYVEDSADSEHLCNFITTDNGEGSLVLRWELEDPVAGGTGGIVKFQARVR